MSCLQLRFHVVESKQLSEWINFIRFRPMLTAFNAPYGGSQNVETLAVVVWGARICKDVVFLILIASSYQARKNFAAFCIKNKQGFLSSSNYRSNKKIFSIANMDKVYVIGGVYLGLPFGLSSIEIDLKEEWPYTYIIEQVLVV